MWLAALGVILLTMLITDVIRTTAGHGHGLFVDRFSYFLATRLTTTARRRRWRRVMPRIGFFYLAINSVLWVLTLWAGWFLIFSASPAGVISTLTGEPADPISRFYYTGYTISTLGIGDFRPNGGLWQLLTAVASLSGLMMVTLVLSLLVPLLTTVNSRRELAMYIHHLGPSGEEIVRRAWHKGHSESLDAHLATIAAELSRLEHRHRYFPILHHFHSAHAHEDLGLALAKLDDAMLLLEFGISRADPRCPHAVHVLRSALGGFLDTSEAVIVPSVEPPPIPSLESLREHNIPTVDDDAFAVVVERHEHQRRLLRTIVEDTCWCWDASKRPW